MPPWEPQEEEPEEEEVTWLQTLLNDGGCDNMGPYTDETAAAQYHSAPFIEGLPFTRRIIEGGETFPAPRPEILPRDDDYEEEWEQLGIEGALEDEGEILLPRRHMQYVKCSTSMTGENTFCQTDHVRSQCTWEDLAVVAAIT